MIIRRGHMNQCILYANILVDNFRVIERDIVNIARGPPGSTANHYKNVNYKILNYGE